MPKTITIADPTYRRIIIARNELSQKLDRRVTMSEAIDLAFDEYEQAKTEGTEQK